MASGWSGWKRVVPVAPKPVPVPAVPVPPLLPPVSLLGARSASYWFVG